MPTYTWEGKGTNGKKVSGELEARDVQAVFNILKSKRIIPSANRIREKGQGLDMDLARR